VSTGLLQFIRNEFGILKPWSSLQRRWNNFEKSLKIIVLVMVIESRKAFWEEVAETTDSIIVV
jgi:hypothetical protein